eukprot:782437-Prymnesium_polylepis.1
MPGWVRCIGEQQFRRRVSPELSVAHGTRDASSADAAGCVGARSHGFERGWGHSAQAYLSRGCMHVYMT